MNKEAFKIYIYIYIFFFDYDKNKGRDGEINPWNRILLKNLIVTQILRKFPAIYGT
jgi:hypothetical protein